VVGIGVGSGGVVLVSHFLRQLLQVTRNEDRQDQPAGQS